MLVDPIQSEFFTTESIGGLGHALVRETIQNALDAKSDKLNEPVSIRFAFLESVDPAEYSDFLDGLPAHINAPNNGLIHRPTFEGPLPFLVIEDFGTRGLEGDPEEEYVEEFEDGKDHNFSYFWRNVGRSGKAGDDRGRWGLGKTVFTALSQINTFWGITYRESDSQLMLMGQSVLRVHSLDTEIRYTPYGHYGLFDPQETYFALPISDRQIINTFCDTFCLERRQGPGLSLAIPMPDEDIDPNTVMRAVVRQYFYPILSGQLVVWVDSSTEPLKIDGESLVNVLDILDDEEDESFNKVELVRLIELTKWAIGLRDDGYISLDEPEDPHRAPSWSYQYLPQGTLEQLRERFDRGERLAFKVPMKVQRVGQGYFIEK